MRRIRNLPNMITLLRLAAALCLPLTQAFSAPFLLLYAFCGLSDALDGYLARRLHAVSRLGQVLDSIADLLFFGIALLMILTATAFPAWILWWVAGIAMVRAITMVFGAIKYRRFALLHTCANKAAGAALFLFPFFYPVLPGETLPVLVCTLGSLSAVEELGITLKAKTLQRDVRSIFRKQ